MNIIQILVAVEIVWCILCLVRVCGFVFVDFLFAGVCVWFVCVCHFRPRAKCAKFLFLRGFEVAHTKQIIAMEDFKFFMYHFLLVELRDGLCHGVQDAAHGCNPSRSGPKRSSWRPNPPKTHRNPPIGWSS